MEKLNTPPRNDEQVVDHLEAMLQAGRAPTLEKIISLEWRLPDDCYSCDGRILMEPPPHYTGIGGAMRKALPLYVFIMIPWPAKDAPLAEHVGRRLLDLRVAWSHDERYKNFTFPAFVREYMRDDFCGSDYVWRPSTDQLLRLACGSPRFRTTKRARS